MPESKYSICGIKNGISILFLCKGVVLGMSHHDIPFDIEEQINSMKKYVVFTKRIKMKRLLEYAGYFRVSRYGKFLLSHTSTLKAKPDQEMLFALYKFDTELRKIFFSYCKIAEVQFRSNLANAVSLKTNDPIFYINSAYYTPTQGEKDRREKERNKRNFPKVLKNIKDAEKDIRQNVNKFPEFKEYRTGGSRSSRKIPCWAAFSSFEFGQIIKIYAYLRGDLRKSVLEYGYSKDRYGKEITKQMNTWLDAIRNLRNVCSHHNRLVGRTSSVVLIDRNDENLSSQTDLFSRMYALKKVLSEKDSQQLEEDINKLIKKTKIDIYPLDILPNDWEEKFERINPL